MNNEKQQLVIILLIVFLGFVGTSIAYPIFPPLFLHPEHGSILPASWHNNTRNICLGIALAAYPLGQFIGSPILGGCSDTYGRKQILVVSLIGTVIGYLLSAISLQYNWLWVLLMSRFLTGMMEGNFAIVRAMAAELESINKYKTLGRINATASIAYVTGPLIGGFLSDETLVSWFSFAFPFYLAVLLSIVVVILAILKLPKTIRKNLTTNISMYQRFNFIARLKLLISNSNDLKHLLIISTTFTFSVDIFYEFGPVYLTGLWSMTPAFIAIYNAILSITLAIGAGWLPHHLSRHYPIERVIMIAMLLTAIFLGIMVVFPFQLLVFVVFGLVGLSIALVTTNMTIQVSNAAEKLIQGEAMGTQLSLRMLGDTLICLIGGFFIISSVILPIALSSFIALIAAGIYYGTWKDRQ